MICWHEASITLDDASSWQDVVVSFSSDLHHVSLNISSEVDLQERLIIAPAGFLSLLHFEDEELPCREEVLDGEVGLLARIRGRDDLSNVGVCRYYWKRTTIYFKVHKTLGKKE
jgi:hypothetical protein